MLCCTEQSYRSAISQINDMHRKKALLAAHSELAKETLMRIEDFTKQIQHKRELLSELRRSGLHPGSTIITAAFL